ncbi:hypothetical protein Bbelb_083140 [Branchiostoma belcheri]|nr:hypothetical protein Bbelb_083140 [Branchiostoma belcheri]
MPVAHIKTNLSPDQISDEFIKETSKMIAELLNKEESEVTIQVDAGLKILRAGSFDPYIQFEIRCIKKFDEEKDKEKYSKAFFDFLSEKLPVQYDSVSRPNAKVVSPEAVKLVLELTHYSTITALEAAASIVVFFHRVNPEDVSVNGTLVSSLEKKE